MIPVRGVVYCLESDPMHRPPVVGEPIALVDLDGTLADYDRALRRDLSPMCSPAELPLPDDLGQLEASLPHFKARMATIRRIPGWWRHLPRIEANFALVELMRDLWFDIHVLTKGPWKSSQAWAEKVDWVREHMPYASLHISEDKGLVYGKVLMDDWPPYIRRWLTWRPRGLVIMPNHPWNQGFEHPHVIRWDGSAGARAEIEDRLWAVRRTALYAEHTHPETVQVPGTEVCSGCGEPYRRHRFDLGALNAERHPYLHVACDGRRLVCV